MTRSQPSGGWRSEGRPSQTFERRDRRGDDRGREDSGRYQSWSGSTRPQPSFRGGDGGSYRRSYPSRQPYYGSGRITSITRHRDGYNVWLGGTRYPFYVPSTHYDPRRFRIGVTIGLGGYYNPLGYYDYYPGYTGSYGYGYGGGGSAAVSSGDLRGVVESVDYRGGSFVVRNEATGSFVTVLQRSGARNVRPGDYVELAGNWTRDGLFQAYEVYVSDIARR